MHDPAQLNLQSELTEIFETIILHIHCHSASVHGSNYWILAQATAYIPILS